MAYLRGKYGPYEGFDVGDLARKRYTDVVLQKAGMWPGDRMLDVECGHGTLSNALALKFTKCRVAATDADLENVLKTRSNAIIEGSLARLDLVVADPAWLPFKDEAFMLSTCALALATNPDRLDVVDEIHRVTAFMGKALLVDVDFAKAAKRPGRAVKSVFGESTRDAMHEMGYGKLAVQRVDTLRGGAVVQMLSAKRLDPEGEEPDEDEEEDEE